MKLQNLVLVAFASTAFGQTTTYQTTSACTTKYGTSSGQPKSSAFKITLPLTFFRKTTTTQTSTITPLPSTTTATVTSTSTLTSTTTDTVTSTSTYTPVVGTISTTETTTTSTVVVTTTVTPATSTVPTKAGFTPIVSAGNYRPKKRSLQDISPEIFGKLNPGLQARAQALGQIKVGSDGKVTASPSIYPTSTICATLVKAIVTSTRTYTASTRATTTLSASTNTVTNTVSTAVTTFTGASAAQTTITETAPASTSTSIVTNTATATTTVTETVEMPTPTVYAQCQSNNIIGSANGNRGITGWSASAQPGGILDQFYIDDPIQCCEACAKTKSCTTFQVFKYNGQSQPTCFVTNPDASVCNAGVSQGEYETGSAYPPGRGWIIGNGQCGNFRFRRDVG